MKMPFGKHRGVSLDQVPKDYLEWLIRLESIPEILRAEAKKALEIPAEVETPILWTPWMIPRTSTVLALIRECLDLGWYNTGIWPILADAMQDEGYGETPDSAAVLVSLRDDGSGISSYEFYEALCPPELAGVLWERTFALCGEDLTSPKKRKPTERHPRTILSPYGKPFTREDVLKVLGKTEDKDTRGWGSRSCFGELKRGEWFYISGTTNYGDVYVSDSLGLMLNSIPLEMRRKMNI